MFGKLFGSKSGAKRGEDQVWMNGAARMRGLCREVEKFVGQGKSVVVAGWTVAVCDALAQVLAAHQPAQCRDLFGREALRAQIAMPGVVIVALASALPLEIGVAGPVQTEILVSGRNASRAADDAIVHFADLLGDRATISFHLALDDELLQKFAGESLKPMLDKLGMRENESIVNTFLTRAIENCQKKS